MSVWWRLGIYLGEDIGHWMPLLSARAKNVGVAVGSRRGLATTSLHERLLGGHTVTYARVARIISRCVCNSIPRFETNPEAERIPKGWTTGAS